MLFDKIGRKFYYPDGVQDIPEGGLELPTAETIYTGFKPYLNTEVEPPVFNAFPEFNDLTLTPYCGMNGDMEEEGEKE